MTLDPELVKAVDRAAKKLGMSRSGFARMALKDALNALRIRELERKQREGYARSPVPREEFTQAWGNDE
jgi:metal-responsive CopG/Arc/MetJ family transcriptional regulator